MKCLRHSVCFVSLAFVATAARAEDAIPQMDPTWFANQLFWLAISFTLLFILVSRVIAPSVHSVLDTRETAIRDAIEQAEFARNEAQATQGVAVHARQNARVQAAEMMAAAQAEASRDAASEMATLDQALARKASHAEAVLEEALAKAHTGVDMAAQPLAEVMVSRLLGFPAKQAVSDGPKLNLAKR